MPDPLIPPDDPAAPPRPEPPPPGKRIVCEFCECNLAPNGDYVSLSARAKQLRGLEEANEALQAQVSDLTNERDEARRNLDDVRAQLTAATDPKRKPFLQREIET